MMILLKGQERLHRRGIARSSWGRVMVLGKAFASLGRAMVWKLTRLYSGVPAFLENHGLVPIFNLQVPLLCFCSRPWLHRRRLFPELLARHHSIKPRPKLLSLTSPLFFLTSVNPSADPSAGIPGRPALPLLNSSTPKLPHHPCLPLDPP
jgi:hypothetical protein